MWLTSGVTGGLVWVVHEYPYLNLVLLMGSCESFGANRNYNNYVCACVCGCVCVCVWMCIMEV